MCQWCLHRRYKNIVDNLICEGFITKQTTQVNYRPMKPISRIETLDIAVKMLRVAPANVSDYRHPFSDIPDDDKIASKISSKQVSRIILLAEIIHDLEPQKRYLVQRRMSWFSNLFVFPRRMIWLEESSLWPYKNANLTTLSWEKFRPNQLILEKNSSTLVSRASDWANTTGGCMPQICKK